MSFLKNSWIGKMFASINTSLNSAQLPNDVSFISSASLLRLVVVGDESSGKSSLLMRIFEIFCLPVSDNIETRRPYLISSRYVDESVPSSMKLFIPGNIKYPGKGAKGIITAIAKKDSANCKRSYSYRSRKL